MLNVRKHDDLLGYYDRKVVNGFVIGIRSVSDFYLALRRKLLRETRISVQQAK